MSARALPRERPPSVKEAAEHIERMMHGRTGSVTLHFVEGRFQKAEYRTFEDARAMPVNR